MIDVYAHPDYIPVIRWKEAEREYVGGLVSGTSLSALVDAGLYETFEHAALAAREAREAGAAVFELEGDIVFLKPDEAKYFCMHASSDLGREILGIVLEHSRVLEDLRSGDPIRAGRARERTLKTRALSYLYSLQPIPDC